MTEQSPYVESLEKRIEGLERQNRIMKWVAALVAMLLFIGTIISCRNSRPQTQTENSSSSAKIIQAERFVLLNSDGKISAELSSKERPLGGRGPCLTINDAEGNERLAIGVGLTGPFAGPFLEMSGTNGQNK
jgi:cell division protein FtsL